MGVSDTAMVDTVAKDLLMPTPGMVDTAVDTEDMVDTDMEVMEVTVSDTAMVDTVERDLLMLMPMPGMAVDMVVMEVTVMAVAMEVMAVTDMVDVTTVRYLTTPKQP